MYFYYSPFFQLSNVDRCLHHASTEVFLYFNFYIDKACILLFKKSEYRTTLYPTCIENSTVTFFYTFIRLEDSSGLLFWWIFVWVYLFISLIRLSFQSLFWLKNIWRVIEYKLKPSDYFLLEGFVIVEIIIFKSSQKKNLLKSKIKVSNCLLVCIFYNVIRPTSDWAWKIFLPCTWSYLFMTIICGSLVSSTPSNDMLKFVLGLFYNPC